MSASTLPPGAQALINAIAGTLLGVETLESRNHDGLDFHDLAVWNIKAALEAAYKAGLEDRQWRAA